MSSFFLLESGDTLLLESGDILLIEDDDGSGSTPDVAADLPAAIVERFNATAALDWVTGGITYGLAQTDEELYCEFHLISNQPSRWTTSENYVKQVIYQFNCYGLTDHDVEVMTEDLIAVFNHLMTRLVFANGTTTMANHGPGAKDTAEYPSMQGDRLRRMHTDFTFTVNRSLP